MPAETINVVHQTVRPPNEVRIKVEKNSKGFNWEVSVTGETVDGAMQKLREANRALESEYGAG